MSIHTEVTQEDSQTLQGNNIFSGNNTFQGNISSSGINTFTGSNTFSSVNKTIYVDQQTGSTADVKFANACAALPAGGGILDATGFGAGVQTIAATVQCGSLTKYVWLKNDPSTVYQPSTASMNMFQFSMNNLITGLHIDTTNQATYSGDAISNAAQGISFFRIDHTLVNMASGSTGKCLHINATNGSTVWAEFGEVNDFTCFAGTAASAIQLQNSGGGFINSIHWSGINLFNMQYGIDIQQAGTAAINGNIFSALECEHSSLSTSLACVNINATGHNGGNDASRNQFYMNSWDLQGSNKGFIITAGSNGFACNNLFVGGIVAITDNSSSCPAFGQTTVWDLQASATPAQLQIPSINLLDNLAIGATGNIDFANSRALRWKGVGGTAENVMLTSDGDGIYFTGYGAVGGNTGTNNIYFFPNGSTNALQLTTTGGNRVLIGGAGNAGNFSVQGSAFYDALAAGSYRIGGNSVFEGQNSGVDIVIREQSANSGAAASASAITCSSSDHFCRANINNSNYHKIPLASEFGTCTMITGTCTFTYASTFTNTPICNATWNGTGTLTGIVKAVPSTSSVVVTSSVGTDTAVMQIHCDGNPN